MIQVTIKYLGCQALKCKEFALRILNIVFYLVMSVKSKNWYQSQSHEFFILRTIVDGRFLHVTSIVSSKIRFHKEEV